MRTHKCLFIGVVVATILSLLLSFTVFIPSINGFSTVNRNTKLEMAVSSDNADEASPSSKMVVVKPKREVTAFDVLYGWYRKFMYLLGLDDGLNAYERSLLVKEKLREEQLQKWIEEQNALRKVPDAEKKFIIIYPVNSGFGNNLAILAEGILMSMMTHRQLMLFKWPSFNLYFNLPIEDYILTSANVTLKGALNTGLQCRTKPKDFLTAENSVIVLRTLCKFLEYVVKEPEYFDWLNSVGFVINPKLRSGSDIRKMVLHLMYTKVIVAHPDILKMVEGEKEKLEWDKYYWIGIQIRTGHMKGDEGRNVFLFKDDFALFEKYALNQTEKAKQKQDKPVKWFVTTDSDEVRNQFKEKYPDYYVNLNCLLAHSFRDVQRRERSEGMLCSLLDNYVLSYVNEAIVTAQSTYGLLATYRNLYIKKIMIYRGDWKRLYGKLL